MHTYYWDSFQNDFEEMIQRAVDAEISIIINIGVDIKKSQEALNQVKVTNWPEGLSVYSTIGIHPDEAIKYAQLGQSMYDRSTFVHRDMVKLEEIFRNIPTQIIAIGECGLDYFKRNGQITNEEKVVQRLLFQSQIFLAQKLNLPLIIHSRDSWEDIFVPELQGTIGVFHSFTGNMTQAQKILDLGYLLGFNCIVTYPKNEELRNVIREMPLEKILTETDCPFLPPQNLRGQRNEPANVAEVVKTITEIKNLSFEKVAQVTFNNTKSLFGF